MQLFDLLFRAFEPVSKIIDNLHTSDEERKSLNNELAKIQNELSVEILKLESQKLEAQSKIIQAEAKGQSWLQRSWRPITMLTFLLLVVLDAFGMLAFRLAAEAWLLLQIGLGGYVVGRSFEKVMPAITSKKQ